MSRYLIKIRQISWLEVSLIVIVFVSLMDFGTSLQKKNVTKENAIMKITEVCGFSTDSIIAFGDDYADIGMLGLCGTGVAMGNAIDEVKRESGYCNWFK